MRQRHLDVLYLEQLQPDWLETKLAHQLYTWFGIIIPAMLLGFLVTTFFSNLVMPNDDVLGLLASSFPGGIIGGLLGYTYTSQKGRSLSQGKKMLFPLLVTATLLGLGTSCISILIDLNSRHSFSLALIGSYARIDGTIFGLWITLLTVGISLHTSALLKRGASTSQYPRISQGIENEILLSTTIQQGIVIGLSAAFSHEFRYGVGYALSNALTYGLSYTLSSILLIALLRKKSTIIEPTEILSWSWGAFSSPLMGRGQQFRTTLLVIGCVTLVITGLSFGLGFGLKVGLIFGLNYVFKYGLSFGVSFGLSLGLGLAASYWFLASLFQGVRIMRSWKINSGWHQMWECVVPLPMAASLV